LSRIFYHSFLLVGQLQVRLEQRFRSLLRRDNGRFQVAIMDLASGVSTTLSETANDESPSFSPNGKMILYATELGGRGALAVVSSDGRIRQRLRVLNGEVREPAWGS